MKNQTQLAIEPQMMSPKPAKPKRNFKGYTIKQLEYKRTIVQLKKDFYKERLVGNYKMLTNGGNPLNIFSSGKSDNNISSSIFGKMFGSLDVFDYISMGVSTVKGATKILKIFKLF